MRLKVQVWIYYRHPDGEHRYLLLKTTPARGAFWQPVTGSVEPGEELLAAAIREAQEESGLEFVSPPELLGTAFEFESMYDDKPVRSREQGYVLEARSPDKVRLDPSEHIEYRWSKADEALSLIKFESNASLLKTFARKQLKEGKKT